ncbi:hypothetical protein M3Y99_01835600 [Aphelenchoides fujianensis]|nr:hypothetical protein M3Y99_01835600 [Aphelenchoides fujianensis]
MIGGKLDVREECRRNSLRRTSSLQLPMSKNVSLRVSGTFMSAMNNFKSSTIFTSTMSAAGLLDDIGRSESPVNLFLSLARYRLCCGFCRLRVGALTIAIFSLIYPPILFALLYFHGTFFNPTQRAFIGIPLLIFLVLHMVAALFVLFGLFYDIHYLLVPFQLSLIVNVIASIGLGILLMASTDRTNTHLFPAFAVGSMVLVGVYLWFLVVCSMTFVLIRDKGRLSESELDIYCNELRNEQYVLAANVPLIERVNSAQF